MRACRRLLFVLVVWAGPMRAQSSGGWTVTAGLEGSRFATTARDTTSLSDAAVQLRPSGRIGVRVAVQRRIGSWAVGAVLGWAEGDAEASNGAVAIRDRTVDLSRYRVAVGFERTVARMGAAALAVELSPTLDLWTVAGESRTCPGVETGLMLRMPLGGVAAEQRLALGLSASPLNAGDVGEGFELRTLSAVSYMVGLRLPL
jgi:hypothetical protein